MSTYSSFTKQLSLVGILQVLIRLRAIFILPLITKILGVVEYGMWSQFTVSMEFLFPIISLGLTGALTRFLAAERDRQKIREGFYSILAIMLGLAVLAVLLIVTFGSFLADRFFDGSLSLLYLLCATLILFTIIQLGLAYFRTFKQTVKYSVLFLSESYGGLILIYFMVTGGYHIYDILFGLFLLKLLKFFVIAYFIVRDIGIGIPRFGHIREYMHFSTPSVPSNISGKAVQLSDRYVIAYYLGLGAVGIYTPAYTLGTMISMLVEPFAFILSPFLADAFDNKREDQVRTFIHYSFKYFLVIGIPLVVGLSVLAKPLLLVLSTPEIAEKAYMITPYVAIAILFYGLTSIISEIYSLFKKTRQIAQAWVIAGVINIGLNLLLVPRYGIRAAAVTTLVAFAIVFFILYFQGKRLLSFTFDWVIIGKSVALSGLFGLMLLIFQPYSLLSLVLAVVLSTIFYGAGIYMTQAITKTEITFFKSLLGKSKNSVIGPSD
ncbi:MAG: oligosaccharide flippase family protein [Candidatus Kerfeldbacteria bacterium]|nr:oligosaccharide flippase family protein [Candidatus Kerfeldbacteria bacterium]